MRCLCCLAAAALVAWPAVLPAQTQRPRVIGGAEFYAVSFDPGLGAKSVSEIAVPLGVAIPVGRRFSFDAGTYVVSAQRKAETGETATISGLTDVSVRGSYQVIPDAVALTVSVNLPTGQASLDSDQLLVAGATATDLIPFPVTSFGSGVNVTSGLAVAVPVSGWAVGFAGSFRYNGDYEPLADTAITLTPGAEYRLRVGVDRIVGQGRVSLGVTYSTFSRDEFGVDQVNGGQRFITQASWSFPVGNHNVSLFVWDIARSADSTVTGTTSVPGARENTVAIGAITSLRTGRNTLRPAVEFRRSWRGETSLTPYGSLFSIGARYFMQASDRFTIVPGLRLDVGSITGVGLTGFSGSLTVRAAL
jgi:hypothetical protein